MYKVLLVDDEPMIKAHTRALLQWDTLDCEIVGEAPDGLEGLRCIERLSPDVVITDVVMPGYSGLEMIEAAGSDCLCRFIVLSGYSEFDYARRALRSGVVDYLLKPVTAADLRDALISILGDGQPTYKQYEERYGAVVAKVIRSIDEHHNDPDFSLGWVCANELFMNETYVGRLFQKRTGMKFTAWVAQKRINEARRMLESGSDVPIGRIAEEIGFINSKYFIEVFRKHMGMSPGQYRSMLMGQP